MAVGVIYVRRFVASNLEQVPEGMFDFWKLLSEACILLSASGSDTAVPRDSGLTVEFRPDTKPPVKGFTGVSGRPSAPGKEPSWLSLVVIGTTGVIPRNMFELGLTMLEEVEERTESPLGNSP